MPSDRGRKQLQTTGTKGLTRRQPSQSVVSGYELDSVAARPLYVYRVSLFTFGQGLGITFGRMLSVQPHINALAQLTRSVFNFYGKAAHSSWGLRFPALITYYSSILLGNVSYGVGAWGDFIRDTPAAGLHSTSLTSQAY